MAKLAIERKKVRLKRATNKIKEDRWMLKKMSQFRGKKGHQTEASRKHELRSVAKERSRKLEARVADKRIRDLVMGAKEKEKRVSILSLGQTLGASRFAGHFCGRSS